MIYERAYFARLLGAEGPFFPSDIDALNALYDGVRDNLTSVHLKQIAVAAGSLICVETCSTTDAYEWPWVVLYEGEIRVAFPSTSVRSIAIYKASIPDGQELDELVTRLAHEFSVHSNRQ